MASTVRSTVYFDPRVYRALRIKAAESGETMSALVSRAVVDSLKEDQVDLDTFEKRKHEPSRPLADVLRDLKRDGIL
jgi:hypothetical protein